MPTAVNVLCIGAGYVGGPTMAVIADQCPHARVTVVDVNDARIAAWNSDALPIFEPGLDEVVKRARGRNLFFSTDIECGIREADIIFVSVNTPTKTFGEGAGRAADLQYWEKTARQILAHAEPRQDRGGEVHAARAHGRGDGPHPQQQRARPALRGGVEPRVPRRRDGHRGPRAARPRAGRLARDAGRASRARQAVADLYATWVPRERIIESNVWSAELSKLTANAFLAQRISSINSISALCEVTEADVDEVAYAIGTDSRIGPRFLKASVGFGGSCFHKDILNLVYIAESYGLHEVARYWESVVRMNDWQESRFVRRMLASMFNTVAGKRIALFGFAFKANTGDTRESAALAVTRQLMAERAHVVITDPKALDNARIDTPGSRRPRSSSSRIPTRRPRGAHAIAVMTEWDLYRTLDYERILASMERPAFVFDGRNILDHQRLFDLGFNVFPIGKTPLRHA